MSAIYEISGGYPYFAQLIGKSCVEIGNIKGTNKIDMNIYNEVLERIRNGQAFPALEGKYKRAVGESQGRALILTLLAEETAEISEVQGGISLKTIRPTAQQLDIQYIDQLVPRLVGSKFGPVLVKRKDFRGTYEFEDPVFCAYVKIRR